jgi:hypothetical protein
MRTRKIFNVLIVSLFLHYIYIRLYKRGQKMRKRKNILTFALVIVLGLFCFTMNTSFAESIQISAENSNFSSPAAETNFIKYGQLDNVSTLAMNAMAVLNMQGDSDSDILAPPQRSVGCSTSCSTRCSTSCSTSCSTYCSTNCTRSCSNRCRNHDYSSVCE